MKIAITAASFGLTVAIATGLEPLAGHWDITPTFDESTQEWTWTIADGPTEKTPESSYFPAFDGDYFSGEGERLARPEGSEWDFFGVPAGEPIWIFPETTTYLTQTEPGMGDTQNNVAFSGNLQVSLAGVDGPNGGHFSLSDNGGTYMATSDGIDSSDVLSKPDSHSHFNWVFTRKGMWRVRLQVVGYLEPGETDPTPTSSEAPLHFAIGGVARWRASNFDAPAVMDEAVAGAEADPDGDRLPNLIEYSLGGDPNDRSATASAHGGRVPPESELDSGRLTLSFHRAISPAADHGITTVVEWSDTLAGPWISGGTEVAVAPVDSDWEKVTIRDAAPVPRAHRFARIRVTELP